MTDRGRYLDWIQRMDTKENPLYLWRYKHGLYYVEFRAAKELCLLSFRDGYVRIEDESSGRCRERWNESFK